MYSISNAKKLIIFILYTLENIKYLIYTIGVLLNGKCVVRLVDTKYNKNTHIFNYET